MTAWKGSPTGSALDFVVQIFQTAADENHVDLVHFIV